MAVDVGDYWFDDGDGVLRVLLVGVASYFSLLFLLLISGKRTLSKMNSFDFIVTIALGSLLASSFLSPNVPFVESVTAFAILIFLQFLISWTSVRSSKFDTLIKSEPRVLFYKERFLFDVMKSERVVESEVYAAMRSSGKASLSEVEAVILETDGSFTVLSKTDGVANTLKHTSNFDREEAEAEAEAAGSQS